MEKERSLSSRSSSRHGGWSRHGSSSFPDSDGGTSVATMLQPNEMLRNELVLHEAARKNSVEVVRKVIAEHVDVNSRNNSERTALQLAAANGHTDTMMVLMEAGADKEASDKYGMNPLLWAASFGHQEALQLLIKNGVNATWANRQGATLLHIAALNNHPNIIQFVRDSLEDFPVDAADKNEKTALHLAAERGHEDIIDKLLALKTDVQKKDSTGQTAVHLAANNGHLDILRKLILQGIEIDDRDCEGRTALHLATERGHAELVKLLLSSNADVNAETTKETNALHVTARHGHTAITLMLLSHGCNINSRNYQGNTPLHIAAINNQSAIVRQLHQAGCVINTTNHRIQTPLHEAIEHGFSGVVEELLLAGANIRLKEKTGKTPLHLAARGSFVGIVDMLIKADRHHHAQEEEMVSIVQCGEHHHCFYGATCNVFSGRQANTPVNTRNDRRLQFKRPEHESTEYMKEILWKLATKQLRELDWKKLAFHWKFEESHIKAIEHQYTGVHSFKEHGYRMLLIWLHGLKKEENPMKELFEGLVAIDRRELAEHVRQKANLQVEKVVSPRYCLVS